MTVASTATPRFLAILKLPEHKVPLLISLARGIVSAMTGNPWFPSPDPPLAAVLDAIEALVAAQVTAQTGLRGAAVARDVKRGELVRTLQYLRDYVQKIANGDVANAASIIESAGMHGKRKRGSLPRIFAAKPGELSGTAVLVAPWAGPHASYEWEYSLDGMKTCIPLPPTTQSTTTVTGLVPGALVHFRYRTVTKDGVGDWSQPVSLMIL
jgi:hypothetical protein